MQIEVGRSNDRSINCKLKCKLNGTQASFCTRHFNLGFNACGVICVINCCLLSQLTAAFEMSGELNNKCEKRNVSLFDFGERVGEKGRRKSSRLRMNMNGK